MQGASQIRQSFSKRKRGIAQKAYQLHKITDAKVSKPIPCARRATCVVSACSMLPFSATYTIVA